MTVPDEVKELAAELSLRVPAVKGINSEEEYQDAMELMEALLEDYDSNLVIIEALSNSVARYEESLPDLRAFGNKVASRDPAVSVLKVLMQQHGLNTSDFEHEIGKKSLVSQILNGHKNLTRNHIEKLAKRFNISPGLFF